MKLRCSRCHRPLHHALELAGMKFGRDCHRAVLEAIQQPQQVTGPEPDPRQIDFFKVADLFGATAEAVE